ncbi:hypothetical protein EA658_09825 [Pseudoxanthomonas winnipegensis]|uniref:Uncharacterized protein n=1 Tax=Pseudoxanthomonas winnipegensis TaxID=2480810 RepID=A0ABY1WCT4_9GAMM|nr:hypothetical protein [Pseudoxanthomonas winnipegensis]TAA12467.1 hypothetical protein EA659_03825 [Pseudoxanthomonas winnipegensis]TAA19168.1 hypothetical protein EA658_09825 [Pseudoxanthomonas winnipegensis]TAH70429.1 hypothetical protein EA657_16890 [Pseudoxanthomonas winnipegensis]
MDCHHIHTPDDGRCPRRVYLNGVALERVVYADTKRGIARVFDDPPRISRRRECAISRKVRGVITVEPIS